ncbi:MAG TPA: endonuclease/exonuclease/phosphatase family protein [Sediminibacterium sp.]|nr:endonuclease/exonuclease/phosphatase family protein [Sediminibacterium sp.]
MRPLYILTALFHVFFLQSDLSFRKAAPQNTPAQTALRQQLVVAFYNLENLYDTVNNSMVNDDEFIPEGAKKYTGEIYRNKLFQLATVLKDIGKTHSRHGAALIGVAEIENDTVLYDLTRHFLLRPHRLKFIHFDSRDARGVDVALFYRPDLFIPLTARPLQVVLPGGSKETAATRDILYVKGYLAGELFHIYVNHWPSRRGGEFRSAPARVAAAKVCRLHMDSILDIDPSARVILMGDLNDNPTDPSISQTLKASGSVQALAKDQLYNPWVKHYLQGFGTLANRDVWGLFDQILVSRSLTDSGTSGLHFGQSFIYFRHFMAEPSGPFKGYPMRSWEGNNYRGGFSDHFPTYIVLLKQGSAKQSGTLYLKE